MSVPIIFEGSSCVGETIKLIACCPSDTQISWEVTLGASSVSLSANGNTADLTILNTNGYKVRAMCCKETSGL